MDGFNCYFMSKKESHWDVFKRCLKIIVRLQQGPTPREELFKCFYSQGEPQAILKRFENDKRRIREQFGIDVWYNIDQRAYVIDPKAQLTVIGLTEHEIDTLILLYASFHEQAPQHEDVHALLNHLLQFVPQEQRAIIHKRLERPDKHTVTLQHTDRDLHTPEQRAVWAKLQQANREHRVVEFRYMSPQQDDVQPRTHTVEPWFLRFDPVRGHAYLEGYCLHVETPTGLWEPRQYITYRPGRIIHDSITILPQHTAPAPRRKPRYRVRYWLSPKIARYDVSERLIDTHVERQTDGSVIVTGWTESLFETSRSLLYYGKNCKVLGDTEVLETFLKLLQDINSQYTD